MIYKVGLTMRITYSLAELLVTLLAWFFRPSWDNRDRLPPKLQRWYFER